MLRRSIQVVRLVIALFARNHTVVRMKNDGAFSVHGLYREEFFRSLLSSESKRSQRSGHCYQLLLVYSINTNGAVAQMEPDLARTVISSLSKIMRDTDYIGWYREGYVVGSVLTVLGRDSAIDGCHRLRTGLADMLEVKLGLGRSRNVQIRVLQQDAIQQGDLII